MPSNQKRKRKRTSSLNRTPAKKARKSKNHALKTGKKDKKPIKKPEQKKRKFNKKVGKKRRKLCKRRKVNHLRQKMARTLERALVEAPTVPLIYHLFTETDSMGTPRAPLNQVLKQLKISNYVKNCHTLRDSHMMSVSHHSTLFAIERDEPDKGLFLKYWPIYDKEAATVYVDNLPEGCREEKLMRLANCYGTVAEVRISKKSARWIRPRHIPKKKKNQQQQQQQEQPVRRHIHRIPPKKKPLINVGSRPRQFGFIRFVDADSAVKMVQDFIVNDPSVPYQRFDEEQRKEQQILIDDILEFGPGDPENLQPPVVPQELPRRRPWFELATAKLILEIRFLKQRRKRRPFPMYARLWKLNRRWKELRIREYGCLRKAKLVPPRVKQRKLRRLQEAAAAVVGAPLPEEDDEEPRNRRDEPGCSSDPYPAETSTPPCSPAPVKKPPVRRHNHHHRKHKKKKFKRKKPPPPPPEGENGEPAEKVKRRRRRKKLNRNLAKYIPGGSVRRYFQQTQVLSMKRYLELKAEYQTLIELEKQRVLDEDAEVPDFLDL
ncbi:unnamed protein product [Caenorhabditis sp. 36 PRJEB53466]|nr:unnamed protein product [Caenorhabditis sp. 36 PRJEB53466]